MSFNGIFSGRGAGGEGGGNGRRYGVDLAKVTNIDDPDKLNRVKCKRVTTDPDVGETDWMYVCSPIAGTNYGLYMMPKVGDLVLLSYLGGDVHRPFVIGSVWTKDVAAPYKIEGGKNETFAFKLPSGTEVVFSETKGKESVAVTTASGARMALDGDGKKIEVRDKDGKNALTMDLNSGAVTVSASPFARTLKLSLPRMSQISAFGTSMPSKAFICETDVFMTDGSALFAPMSKRSRAILPQPRASMRCSARLMAMPVV